LQKLQQEKNSEIDEFLEILMEEKVMKQKLIEKENSEDNEKLN